jgi:hypothetical protein
MQIKILFIYLIYRDAWRGPHDVLPELVPVRVRGHTSGQHLSSHLGRLSLRGLQGIGQCRPETHTKRQAAQHGCLPSLLGDGDKGIEIVYGEKKKIFCTGLTRAAKAE